MLRLHMTRLLDKAGEFGDASVADVARRTGISRSTLHRLAAGTKQPSLPTLWTLRGVYGVCLDTLVYDDPHPSQEPPGAPPAAAAAQLTDPGADFDHFPPDRPRPRLPHPQGAGAHHPRPAR
ncbi:helix-turn-helix transcriptional regulator [Streptomyces sp. NPDC059575]|uniref:helix-turn-helix domain-containing protein n=2 Tax=unclassified Streptomyces TaxID=2593676 RepID=UPI00136F424A|nr:helix-turn-helix domain-containing protein [Streptomyces sp. SID4985]